MKLAIKVQQIPSFTKTLGKFSSASKNLEKDLFSKFHRHGKRLHNLVLAEAPVKTGKFKRKIRYRTYQGSGKIGLAITTPLPLGRFIIGGTKRHPIPKVPGGTTLRFFWPKGPSGAGIYYYKQVQHPGTKPNPFLGRAYRKWLPGARRMMAELAKDYVVRVTK